MNDEDLTKAWLEAQALVYTRHQDKRSRDHDVTHAHNLLSEALKAEEAAWEALETHRRKIVGNRV